MAAGVGAFAKQPVQCVLAVLDVNDMVGQITFPQGAECHFRIARIVLHEEDFDFSGIIHF